MFKASITSTPFTTDAANDYFEHIYGDSFGGDQSFLATLRALVAPRIPDGETVRLIFGNSRFSASEINGTSVENAVRVICENNYYIDDMENGTFYVHNFSNTSENNMASMACLEKKLTSVYNGFARLEAITAFFKKTFNVDCFINAQKKVVLVFVDGADNRKMHYLQCAILAMLPWYFDKTVGVTAKEMELIQSLRETSPDNYQRVLMELSELYDFKTARIKKMLKGFERRYERAEYEQTMVRIDRIDNEIDDLERRMNMKLQQRTEECIRLAGLDRRINEDVEGESEIMEYFLCNNKLNLINVTNNELKFAVKDYITYFDRDMAHSMIANKRSVAYGNPKFKPADVEKLLTELFDTDTPRLKVKTCAAYRLYLNGGDDTVALRGYTFGAEFDDAIPNMHIQRHACLGNYRQTIYQLLMERNYIGALEQCIASCKSLNFGDITVIREFFDTFLSGGGGYNNRCIELPDGKVVKPADAIRWLKDQDQTEEVTGDGQEAQAEGE